MTHNAFNEKDNLQQLPLPIGDLDPDDGPI